ncbi:MAG: acyltransferase [Bacteroidales bacterium]|jgi:peptidoglycan/LPS O-acetylase OafA/YrhL|nr:acyltransferase [Bacteroidales bacterium]
MIPSTKPHYEILDGLRGVAAIVVLFFHIFEGYTLDPYEKIFNHGYLAVDFFFVLSGFVIGYAYDDRWGKGKMNLGNFFKRRLIRLHPMVVMGMVLGAVLFYFGASPEYPLIANTPVWKMLLYLVLGILLFPTPASMDIRGWGEMHTLDAPCWSLFFEYIANILYGLFIRKFSTKLLAVLVFLAACATIHLTVIPRGIDDATGLIIGGDVSGGWTFNADHLRIGFTRLIYPFFAGLLLYRLGKLTQVKNAFLWCTVLLVIVFIFPRVGDHAHFWMNGIYESVVIILVFPLIVYWGASGKVKGKYASKICKFLGDISYPVYLVNYPIIYIWTGYISKQNFDTSMTLYDKFAQSWWGAVLVFVSVVALSVVSLKLYDEPVRKWISRKTRTH